MKADIYAHYKLDETTGNVADSINGYNLTLNGAVTRGVAGIVGPCYYFTGNAADFCTGPSPLAGATEWTISAWVKLNRKIAATQTFISGLAAHPAIAPILTQFGTEVFANFASGYVNSDNYLNIAFGNDNRNLNEWYLVTQRGVIDGTGNATIKLTVNNQYKGSQTTNGKSFTAIGQTLVLGKDGRVPNFEFQGWLSDIKIWRRQLTDCEIYANYNKGAGLTTWEDGYYVDAVAGLDSNNGLSPATAVKTLGRVNELELDGTIRKVFLKRGQSWEGTIEVKAGGSAARPVIYSAYGVGDKPVIDGSQVITGWTHDTGNIYKKTMDKPVTQLFVGGQKMQVARLTKTGYSNITARTSNSVFTINADSNVPDNYYRHCTVIMRTKAWLSNTRLVTASTGSTITIDISPVDAAKWEFEVVVPDTGKKQSVLLMNKRAFLNAPGEWCQDAETNTIYLWKPDGTPPTDLEVRGSVFADGILCNAKNYVQIKNIEFRHQKEKGVNIIGVLSNYILVNGCHFTRQNNYGIYAQPNTGQYHNYGRNTFSDINGNAIYGYNLGFTTVEDNEISKTGLFADWGIGYNMGSAIEISTGDSVGKNVIRYNKITESGYNGIMWRGLADIYNNFVKNSCLAKGDGGGIYSGSATTSYSQILSNIVDGVLGNSEASLRTSNYGFGIYIDEKSIDVTAEHNIVLNCSDANVFLHKPDKSKVRYNILFNGRYNFMCANPAKEPNFIPSGISDFENNLCITGAATDDFEPRQLNLFEKIATVGFTGNTFINGFANNLVFRGTDQAYINFDAWKTFSGHNNAGSYTGTLLQAEAGQRVVYNATKEPQNWYINNAADVLDANMNPVTGMFELQPYTGRYLRGKNLTDISTTAAGIPLITAFVIPANWHLLTVPVTTFTAFDADGIAGYILTETNTAPALNDAGWTLTAPATYTFASAGAKTLYAWVKDSAGNLSASVNNAVVIAPVVLLPNVVAWYEANTASGTTVEDEVSGNQATLIGGAVINQTGQFGKAVLFDGENDYMTAPNPAVFAAGMPNDFSVLVRFKQPTPEAANKVFVTEISTSDFCNISLVSGVFSGNVAKNNVRRGRAAAAAISTTEWHTGVVTFTSATNTVKAYLNGVECTVNIDASVPGSIAGDTNMKIARMAQSTTYANLLWETLGVFNKALTPDEVVWLQDKEFADL